MKKTLCILFAAMMMICTAAAESLDLSSMTLEELKTLRSRIDAEIQSRSQPPEGDTICDDEVLSLTLTNYEFADTRYGKTLTLHCEWTNKLDGPHPISDWVSMSVSAHERYVTVQKKAMNDVIRAHTSYAFDIVIDVPDWADAIDVEFYSYWTPSNVYKTYTFPVTR